MSNPNPRDRNRVRQGAAGGRDAQVAGLPAVPPSGDRAVYEFMNAIKERLEVRDGGRGDPLEKAVTFRDLDNLGLNGQPDGHGGQPGSPLVRSAAGGFATVSMDTFADTMRDTSAYRSITGKSGSAATDPVPQEVRDLLATGLAQETARREDDIRRVEQSILSDQQSSFDTTTRRSARTVVQIDGSLIKAGTIATDKLAAHAVTSPVGSSVSPALAMTTPGQQSSMYTIGTAVTTAAATLLIYVNWQTVNTSALDADVAVRVFAAGVQCKYKVGSTKAGFRQDHITQYKADVTAIGNYLIQVYFEHAGGAGSFTLVDFDCSAIMVMR